MAGRPCARFACGPQSAERRRGAAGCPTELADRAIVSTTTVADIERGDVSPRVSTLEAIIRVLESAGIEFLRPDREGRGQGVRLMVVPVEGRKPKRI
ncbi:MAG: helix-turn-helix domain-containing protein [Magnetospirillum sp.]|nr:helix-turn-helix domain-containing protein [Magnetospirillum sp.]